MRDLTAAYALCFDTVRRDDPDRWIASLYWPEAARPHAHALLAFDAEVAKIGGVVREPMAGEIRLQWWRDAITKGEPVGNPVAVALLDTVRRFNLDTAALLALIEAHGFDLYTDPMPSQPALDAYLHDTSVTLFEAIARVLAPGRLPPAAVAAAGRAYGLTNLLRGLPYQVMKGQLFIPLDLLAKFQLPPEHVLTHRNSPALGLVFNALRAQVQVALREMETGLVGASPARSTCLPAYLCEPFLERMNLPGHDPFKTPIELPKWRRQWVLWRAARRL